MVGYSNYHTHTRYCDGANTVEEMVLSAIKDGLLELGFSGHSYLPFDPSWTMSPENEALYISDVLAMKEKYKSEIKILLGIEQDYCSSTDALDAYDFVIGGVHCVFRDDNYISVDGDLEGLQAGIDEFYNGNSLELTEDYYGLVADLYKKTKCQIVGHFDLLTKFSEKSDVIDTKSPRYMDCAVAAIDDLLENPLVFEINTGAISRGYRTTPYPDERILRYIAQRGGRVILSSDSHSVDTLTYGFDKALALVDKYNSKLVHSIDEI